MGFWPLAQRIALCKGFLYFNCSLYIRISGMIYKSCFDLSEPTEKGAADENAKDEEIGRIKSLYLKSGKRSLGKMKLLSIVVPCFNSEKYVRRCMDSLITGGDDVEIIVVDSDDWLDEEAYRELLEQIRRWARQEEGDRYASPDLVICNYTYNHLDDGMEKTMNYRNVFPERQVCTWDEIKSFRPSQYLIMHALLYRTEVLRKSGLVLPEHTFYVDNIFAYYPLPYVKTLYYMDIDLYQYYLGREDQSVNEKVLISRIEQQIKVTKIVAECVDLREVRERHPKLANYMCRNVSIMMAISSIHLLLSGEEGARTRHREIWDELKRENPGLYYRLRYTKLSGLTNLPGKLGKKATVDGYRIARKIYKFQ